ncbi:unnamed protein product, partial [Brenthis ino]
MSIFKLTTTHLKDRETCLSWLRSEGLLISDLDCPICKYQRKIVKKMILEPGHGLGRFKCKYRHDQKTISATQGTWFENVKVSPEKVVLLTYAFANKFNQEQAIKETSIDKITSSATVVDWYSYCREVCMISLDEQFETEGQIGGLGKIVEIDESLVEKRKYNRGRPREGNWILGMIEKDGPGYRLEICPDNKRERNTLFPLIQKHIAPGTEIWTDCWKAYEGLADIPGKNYTHKTVNHSSMGVGRFVEPTSGVNTQAIEGSWKHLKYEVTNAGYKKEALADHLCTYMWHRIVRNRREDPFDCMWQAIKNVYPLKESNL